MLMQNFGVTNKEYYGMLWYFLEWSIGPIGSLSKGVFELRMSTGSEEEVAGDQCTSGPRFR